MSPPITTNEMRDEHDRSELIDLLAATLGEDTARRVLVDAARSLGIASSRLTRTEAFATLELIATEPGLVGLTARLAKARFRAKTIQHRA